MPDYVFYNWVGSSCRYLYPELFKTKKIRGVYLQASETGVLILVMDPPMLDAWFRLLYETNMNKDMDGQLERVMIVMSK